MDQYHTPEHRKLVEEILAGLDGEEIAAKANALTGGCMRGEDALKLAGMVALAALHAPGTPVLVAGFGAKVIGESLEIFMHDEVATKNFPKVETEEV